MTVTEPESWEPDLWGGRSIATVLTDEHGRLETLLADAQHIPAEDATRRRQVADALIASLSRHISAEEQELYPAARTALPNGDQVIDSEIAADREILLTLQGLHSADAAGDQFDAVLARVELQLRRHVEALHDEVFPEFRRRVSREEQVKLGNRVDIFEEAAPTRPHPNTPSTPPLNKVVDPALGTVDKVRDMLSGRKTRPQDL